MAASDGSNHALVIPSLPQNLTDIKNISQKDT